MNMNVEGWRGRGRSKKRWSGCVRLNMKKMDVRDEMIEENGNETCWDDLK
jgi:hypothetical protein